MEKIKGDGHRSWVQQELDKKAPKVKRVVGKTFAFYLPKSFGT